MTMMMTMIMIIVILVNYEIFSDKVLNKLISVSETRKEILINIKKILTIIDKRNNISKNDLKLKLDEYKKLNIFLMI